MSAKHTPGPWFWVVNPKSHCVELSRGQYGDIVMGFDRWGMSGATPLFGVDGLMKKAVDVSKPQPGRKHHAEWWRIIDHPDAHLIAAAPELLAVARRWLRVMGDAGSDRCGCRPDESYVCCRCEVVAAIAKAEGKS